MDPSVTRSNEIALAPPSQLTSRASVSTDLSNDIAQNTGSSVSANDMSSTKPELQPGDGFDPMEMEAPHESRIETISHPTELR